MGNLVPKWGHHAVENFSRPVDYLMAILYTHVNDTIFHVMTERYFEKISNLSGFGANKTVTRFSPNISPQSTKKNPEKIKYKTNLSVTTSSDI